MNWYNLLERIAECQGDKFEERPLQKEIVGLLQKRFEESKKLSVPIFIRLPCGYGKTQIGESPFLGEVFMEKWYTKGMVYVLPTRSLTTQQMKRIQKDLRCVCRLKSHQMLSVKDFHGEADTYYFYADAVISTFDTFIYAYARKSRTGYHLEFPAGTISTSYIVFDEAHMIQDDYLYSHTVMNRVLRVLSRSGIPTIVMTATMPKPIEKVVFDGICYEKYPRFEEEFKHLGSYRGEVKYVRVHKKDIVDYVRESLSLETINNKRILVVCNTVRKAQNVY
ncbi:TPA: DEAD/DEAH box helicase, partial [Candidatus Bathyarchaeota archaeon]|nr:DEAD/DEAH box helicase [Candidatus Bathyarchaeota archaeon]